MKNRFLKNLFSLKSLISLILIALCILLLLFEGCKPVRDYQKKEGLVFGTIYHITYDAEQPLDSVIEAALRSVDESLSLFNDHSTLVRLNNGDTVDVDELYTEVFSVGQSVNSATEGCFDMTVAPLVNLYGFGTEGRMQDTCGLAVKVDSIRQFVGMDKCTLGSENGKMWLDGGVKLDAAAIAKGFGCDVVAKALSDNGCNDYCVEIGGEVVVRGLSPRGDKWRIGVNKPEEDTTCMNAEIEKIMELTDCAMATSGNYRNFYEVDKTKVGHTVDPRTGKLAKTDMLSATIIADRCIVADAWATACMVAGVRQATEWMMNHQELSAFFIYEENGEMKTITITKGKKE